MTMSPTRSPIMFCTFVLLYTPIFRPEHSYLWQVHHKLKPYSYARMG